MRGLFKQNRRKEDPILSKDAFPQPDPIRGGASDQTSRKTPVGSRDVDSNTLDRERIHRYGQTAFDATSYIVIDPTMYDDA